MIERLDSLEVDAVQQGKHEVSSAEARVHPAVAKAGSECGAESLDGSRQTFGSGRVGEVVESHGWSFCSPSPSLLSSG